MPWCLEPFAEGSRQEPPQCGSCAACQQRAPAIFAQVWSFFSPPLLSSPLIRFPYNCLYGWGGVKKKKRDFDGRCIRDVHGFRWGLWVGRGGDTQGLNFLEKVKVRKETHRIWRQGGARLSRAGWRMEAENRRQSAEVLLPLLLLDVIDGAFDCSAI